MGKIIIDGNSVYEVDEECIRRRERRENREEEEKGRGEQKEHSR